jgi:type VI secretion system protein VasG
MLDSIIRLQLGRIERRVSANHRVPFTYDPAVVDLIRQRCTELESGGRMIDAILTNTVLPSISREFLLRMRDDRPISAVKVIVENGDFGYEFDARD